MSLASSALPYYERRTGVTMLVMLVVIYQVEVQIVWSCLSCSMQWVVAVFLANTTLYLLFRMFSSSSMFSLSGQILVK